MATDDDKPNDALLPVMRGPLLPLRDIVVFPHMVVPLFVGRGKSIAALEAAMEADKFVLLAAQRKAGINNPSAKDIFPVGTIGTVLQLLRLPDGTLKVLVEGKRRAKISQFLPGKKYFFAEFETIREQADMSMETNALVREVKTTFDVYLSHNKQIPQELMATVHDVDDPSRLADLIAVHLSYAKLDQRQEVLECFDVVERLNRIYEFMKGEIEILQVERRIRGRVKKQMARSQKEYYLNEQMQAIQRELGEKDEFRNELLELEKTIRNKPDITEEALDKCSRELKKLQMMPAMSAESTVIRNYLDWISLLPWGKKTQEPVDLNQARSILDEDHWGLDKIKERIVEHLAVQVLSGKLTGPILCFVGPPGTGKTSLAASVARATGRKFVRQSLGGVRDEAEIRGHRRTYIGAMPGKIIQSLRKAGTDNPVFLLDEIDKMTSDFRGDPASALLEVLDPEQNSTFNDHYMDMDYDLSDVMFLTTANLLSNIPEPLKDRMEIVELNSYTEFEKLKIAQNYLVPKQQKKCGLGDRKIDLTAAFIRTVINTYTREAGVRTLERELATVFRKLACKVVADESVPQLLDDQDVSHYLGIPRYSFNKKSHTDQVGLVNGLAVTSVGGDLLHVEVSIVKGKGRLIRTGRMGDVMQEASEAALTYVRSRTDVLGISSDFLASVDIHVHFPEGAVPKDGPSAGIATATCIVSALTKKAVRGDLAMTGEITLRGRVLPIGGVKEKILAARRGRVQTVIIPVENRKDLQDVPSKVMSAMDIVLVDHMDQVLSVAFSETDAANENSLLVYKKGELFEGGQTVRLNPL